MPLLAQLQTWRTMVEPDQDLQVVLGAMAAAWDDGCPVARPDQKTARVAVRRWRSHANRKIVATDVDGRVEDLAVTFQERTTERVATGQQTDRGGGMALGGKV